MKAGCGLHAVRVGYLLAGMADLYLETGNAYMIEHLEGLWNYIGSAEKHIMFRYSIIYVLLASMIFILNNVYFWWRRARIIE